MKQYTSEQIEQKLKELNESKASNDTKNVFTHWSAWLVYLVLIWLGIELLLKLKSVPYIGFGIVIVVVLFLFGIPAMKKILKQNSALRKSDKEKDRQIRELSTMLKQTSSR